MLFFADRSPLHNPLLLLNPLPLLNPPFDTYHSVLPPQNPLQPNPDSSVSIAAIPITSNGFVLTTVAPVARTSCLDTPRKIAPPFTMMTGFVDMPIFTEMKMGI